jgi:hypothetical protein
VSTPFNGAQNGQALIETALVIPVMFALMLGFLAVLVRVEAQVELETATSLAAAAAVSAPANDDYDSRRFATQTYTGTLRSYPYLEPGTLTGCGGYAPGQTVHCEGRAVLRYSRTPMALVVPFDIPIEVSADAQGSTYRSEGSR